MIYQCDYCKKDFKKSPAQVNYKTKCCSQECSILLRQPKVIVNCLQCDKELRMYPSTAKTKKYCSRQCAMLNRTLTYKGLPNIQDNNLLCHQCLSYKSENEFYDFNKVVKYGVRNKKMRKCIDCWNQTQIERRHKNQKTIEGTLKGILKRSLSTAKGRELECNISYEFLIELYQSQNGICALSGQKMTPSTYYDLYTISLDRIDSSKGYTKDNVQLVCWIVNQMKSDLTVNELVKWSVYISKYNKK